MFNLAHVDETSGVFVNSQGNELTWFHPKWTCRSDSDGQNCYNTVFGDGDAFLIGLSTDQHWNGAWCDWHKDVEFPFICEGLI